jgi:hypothetical protein
MVLSQAQANDICMLVTPKVEQVLCLVIMMFLHKSTNAAREIREIIQGLTIFGMSIYR